MRLTRLLVAACLLLAIRLVGQAQKLAPGPQVLTFFSDVDDTEQPYGLYLPKNYNPKKKYPLVVMLHGAGSNHRLELRRVFGKSNANGETDIEASRYFPEWADVNYIVASPFARGTAGYQGIPEKDVYDVLADVKKRFNIDEDRTYLTGLSMGGGGTLWIGLSRPDIWAAIAPVCPAPPKGTDELAANATNFPVHLFQGDADPAVKPEGTRQWVKKFQDLGVNVTYKEYPGVKHDSWVQAYENEFIFGWFDQFKRNRFPERVRFSTKQYKYTNAYWVQVDQLTPGTLASVDAKFSGSNHIDVTTTNVGALTLKLTGHPNFKVKKPVDVVIDGKTISTQASDNLTLVKRDGGWEAATAYQPTAKRAGAEGPLSEAFASRHLYVYGTADNPSADELKARQEMATQAANWANYRGEFLGRIMVFPHVVADKDVRPSDIESANLILFGTKETNSLVNQYSNRLPIQLSATSAKEYGLFYVFPMNNHYVAVSSGLPWWSGVQSANYFTNRIFDSMSSFNDFVLFKESSKTPVVTGYFDQSWHVADADAKTMAATGAVVIPEASTATR
ncbi:phospholipase [Spirosoma sp. HMF4905]|uniref:Phospholipase n=1 Tax=Spirosoma arboris TaxID=2682092 RepID=A0A7K1S7R9_9BACT|nr:alpha/beta hydrolase-fold protein [Spirosoma arboris]MVM29825.1 phospholipase [Spirosoma arboris]